MEHETNILTDFSSCPVHSGVVDNLLEVVGPCGQTRVLQVNCSTGEYLAAVVEATQCQGWGIDSCEDNLTRARQQFPGNTFRRGTPERLAFDDNTLDFVFTVDSTQHLGPHSAYFREAYRVLKPGGRLCTVAVTKELVAMRQPLASYFPEVVELEQKQCRSTEELYRLNITAGFGQLTDFVVGQPYEIRKLEDLSGRSSQYLRSLSASAYREGIKRMESDLRRRPLQGNFRYFCLWATK